PQRAVHPSSPHSICPDRSRGAPPTAISLQSGGTRSTRGARVSANPKKKPSGTMAERADIHDLYERSVQAVDVETEFLQQTFRELRGREAMSFREDFCGTASLCCEWARSGAKRHAVGVDID